MILLKRELRYQPSKRGKDACLRTYKADMSDKDGLPGFYETHSFSKHSFFSILAFVCEVIGAWLAYYYTSIDEWVLLGITIGGLAIDLVFVIIPHSILYPQIVDLKNRLFLEKNTIQKTHYSAEIKNRTTKLVSWKYPTLYLIATLKTVGFIALYGQFDIVTIAAVVVYFIVAFGHTQGTCYFLFELRRRHIFGNETKEIISTPINNRSNLPIFITQHSSNKFTSPVALLTDKNNSVRIQLSQLDKTLHHELNFISSDSGTWTYELKTWGMLTDSDILELVLIVCGEIANQKQSEEARKVLFNICIESQLAFQQLGGAIQGGGNK